MGGATSRFEETDWTKANGGLIAQEDEKDHPTIDGSSPTRSYRTYEIIKQSKMTSQREFEVIDPKKRHLLYITRPVPGTLAWFDVLNPNSSSSSQLVDDDGCNGFEDFILRVETDLSRRTWMVYRYHTPVFEGQRPATMKVRKGLADNVKLYKAACITVSWSRYTAVAARYRPPSLEDVLEIEAEGRGDGNDNIDNNEDSKNDMSPSKRSLVGTPSSSSRNTPTSAATRVASMFRSSTSFQSNDTNDDEVDDDDDDDDMMAQAAKIAASRRSISVETSTTESTTISPSERLARNRERVQQALKKCSPCHGDGARNDSPETSFRNPNSFDSLSEYIKRQPTATSMSSEDNHPDGETTPTGSATKLREMFQAKSRSISSRLFQTTTEEEEGNDDDNTENNNESGDGDGDGDGKDGDNNQRDSARKDKRSSIRNRSLAGGSKNGGSSSFLSQSERNVVRRQTALERAMEGIIDLGKNSTNNNNYDAAAAATTSPNGGLGSQHIIDYDDDDPSAAPPALLQVEEIYNKLIGTHQTSYVSRDQVIQMLATEEAQQQKKDIRGKLSPAANNNNNNNNNNNINSGTTDATTNTTTTTKSSGSSNPLIKAVESQGNGSNNAAAAAATPTSKRNSWLGFGLIPRTTSSIDDASVLSTASTTIIEEPTMTKTTNTVNSDDDENPVSGSQEEGQEEEQLMTLDDIIPGGLQSLLDDDIPTITSPTSIASSTGSGSPAKGRRTSAASSSTGTITPTKSPNKDSSSSNNSSSPLVGYWTWKNTYKVHKMRLHLAKNSDLAMHVVLAILVNQVRYERNALAMTV